MPGDHTVVAFPLPCQTLAELEIVQLKRLEKIQVLFFLLGAAFTVHIPNLQFFVVCYKPKHLLCIDAILVDFIEVLGHLCRLASKNAEVAVLLHMQSRVDVDEFKQQVDSVG